MFIGGILILMGLAILIWGYRQFNASPNPDIKVSLL